MKVEISISPQGREILIDGEPMGKPYSDCLYTFSIEHDRENDISLFKPVFWIDTHQGKLDDALEMDKRCEKCNYREEYFRLRESIDERNEKPDNKWQIWAMVISSVALMVAIFAILRVLR